MRTGKSWKDYLKSGLSAVDDVKSWMRSPDNQGWLLVLDNYDDLRVNSTIYFLQSVLDVF